MNILLRMLFRDRGHDHPPLDPALQRSRSVRREIVRRSLTQKGDDFAQPVRCRESGRCCFSDMPEQCAGYFGGRQHQVDQSRFDCAARHAVEACFIRVLRDGKAAFLPNGNDPLATIFASARQDHGDRARTVCGGQRVQQEVEWQTGAVAHPGFRQMQRIRQDGQIHSRGDDIKVFGLDRHAVLGL